MVKGGDADKKACLVVPVVGYKGVYLMGVGETVAIQRWRFGEKRVYPAEGRGCPPKA
jgi:hypothetical protein